MNCAVVFEKLKQKLGGLFPKRRKVAPRHTQLERLQHSGLVVGSNFNMLQGVVIDPDHCWHIEIGNDVTLAPFVHILAHDASTKMFLGLTKIGKVTIGNKVFIGASTIILPGVRIGSNVVIGAGSVVTHSIPDNVVAIGNPARVVCGLDEFLTKRRAEMIKFPSFGEEYTLRKDVCDQMKAEMNALMAERFGYID
jgi:maltose O-acetyltransferase